MPDWQNALCETVEPQEIDILRGCSVDDQIRRDLADDWAKLVPMTGTWRQQQYLVMIRVTIDNKMLVRRVRIEARRKLDRRTRAVGKISFKRNAQKSLVAGICFPVNCLG